MSQARNLDNELLSRIDNEVMTVVIFQKYLLVVVQIQNYLSQIVYISAATGSRQSVGLSYYDLSVQKQTLEELRNEALVRRGNRDYQT